MCDTNEHMNIGDMAAAWLPILLEQVTSCFGNAADYSADALGGANVLGRGGWFNEFTAGQFKYGPGANEWASYGDILALSGDYFSTEADIASNTATVDALLKEWHEKIKFPARTLVDPDQDVMVVRAMENWPHFGFEAVELWLMVHREAIQMAIDGRKGKFKAGDVAVKGQGFTAVVAGLMLALRHNAFGDHYLSDLFSAGHMRVARRDVYNFLNPDFATVKRSESAWLVDGTSSFTDGKQKSDVASILSGILHDEDGEWGLWCTLLFGNCQLNGLNQIGPIAGRRADPDKPGASRAVDWDFPTRDSIGSFYARGDDGLDDSNNSTNKALCYYAIGLSIRDILIASVTGEDPSNPGLRSKLGYWDVVGGLPSPEPLYAALRLVPRPDDPDRGWQMAASNLDGRKNHFPLIWPDYGMGTYYDMLKQQMRGEAFNRAHTFTLRGATDSVGGISYSRGDYSPGTSSYFDYLGHLHHGDPTAGIDAKSWRTVEYGRMIERYARYKGPGGASSMGEDAKRKAQDKAQEMKNKLDAAAARAQQQAESATGAAEQKFLDQAKALRDRSEQLKKRIGSHF